MVSPRARTTTPSISSHVLKKSKSIRIISKFPSQSEQTVASSLLLLPHSLSSTSSSTVTSDGLIVLAIAAAADYYYYYYPDSIKLKTGTSNESKSTCSTELVSSSSPIVKKAVEVIRRRRSNRHRNRTITPVTSTEISCVSNGSSNNNKQSELEKLKRARSVGYLRKRAERILKVLARGCFSETQIRKVVGESRDTSKTLRLLLKLKEVERSGAGGCKDPYIYMVAGSGSNVDSA